MSLPRQTPERGDRVGFPAQTVEGETVEIVEKGQFHGHELFRAADGRSFIAATGESLLLTQLPEEKAAMDAVGAVDLSALDTVIEEAADVVDAAGDVASKAGELIDEVGDVVDEAGDVVDAVQDVFDGPEAPAEDAPSYFPEAPSEERAEEGGAGGEEAEGTEEAA